jgi:hypothetical protein
MSGGMISMIFGMNEIGAAISDEMGAPLPTVLRKPAASNDENQTQRGCILQIDVRLPLGDRDQDRYRARFSSGRGVPSGSMSRLSLSET